MHICDILSQGDEEDIRKSFQIVLPCFKVSVRAFITEVSQNNVTVAGYAVT